ncbi:hypothetical protein BGZ61DRAFT_526363 [Ilyonectria robusta]|uniref:uncharacterized protein n=1 Tax=Ilyonectria robusta TaxID=1079257 RepID=UPI001E8ED03C|nr:uncharacterized protein BGZ61DRAFT_526363 [Ilyonectria robusta]KAH8738382.1 hypothetical protein BGZ61DRAFT_526363 [Ilyonectria robusta]
MATSWPLLKSAACAQAAKHLYCIRNIDLQYQAAKYYHRGISDLKTAITLHAFDADPADHTSQTLVAFATIAIPSMYELMHAPGIDWKAHLNSLPLLSPAYNPIAIACSSVNVPRTIFKGPIFAVLRDRFPLRLETQTHFDMPLWQNAGSAADENGGLLSHNPSGTADLRALTDIQKYTRSNKLIWLPGRIVNYLTSRNAIRPADFALLPGQRFPIGVPQDQLFGRWNILDADLQKWYDSLSPTFQASARTKRHNTMPADDDFANLEEIWYELPICATTMQRYHMACILLLVNKPQESMTIRTTLLTFFADINCLDPAIVPIYPQGPSIRNTHQSGVILIVGLAVPALDTGRDLSANSDSVSNPDRRDFCALSHDSSDDFVANIKPRRKRAASSGNFMHVATANSARFEGSVDVVFLELLGLELGTKSGGMHGDRRRCSLPLCGIWSIRSIERIARQLHMEYILGGICAVSGGSVE